MKHWKETIIKSKEIKWKRPPIKTIEDNKLDVIVTIPLTALFEAQAERSFAEGMLEMLRFHIQSQNDKKLIDVADLVKLFNECGFPRIAKRFNKADIPKQ